MISVKSEGKKNQQYIILLAGVLVIVIALVYYFFFYSNGKAEVVDGPTPVTTKKLEIKKINLDIFDLDNFTKLEDYRGYFKNDKVFEKGNKNPFLSGK